jgi:septal ring factor EnvC (AmiA/AmiB activator)
MRLRFPFVARRRLDALAEELAAATIVNGRLTDDLVGLRSQLAASVAAEGALARQIHTLAQPVEPTDACIDDMNRLIRELEAERKRTDHLQARLDDAVGLGAERPLDSRSWQPGYVAPKPDPKPEVAP